MAKSKNNNADNIIVLERDINEPIGDYAVRCLEYNITTMNLVPGTFISEKIISEMLSISRTPIREAFSRLEKINLIEIIADVFLLNKREIFRSGRLKMLGKSLKKKNWRQKKFREIQFF